LSVRRRRPFPTGKRTLPSNGHFSQTPSSELDDLSRLSLTTARSARAHRKPQPKKVCASPGRGEPPKIHRPSPIKRRAHSPIGIHESPRFALQPPLVADMRRNASQNHRVHACTPAPAPAGPTLPADVHACTCLHKTRFCAPRAVETLYFQHAWPAVSGTRIATIAPCTVEALQ
jgi:hypothetical protein